MSRFLNNSSRRLVAVLALATATAVPSLVVIAGQTPAGASTNGATTTVATMVTNGNKWR
jgi:multisubunit Na+/H+ antiporter MnhB subunit